MEEKVILVDKNDNQLGILEKMAAHLNGGTKHRAFSVLIFNDKNELMLQQRAISKYHCGGLWTNTCCSHPRLNETTESAAHRRLMEEMGFDCELKEIFSFNYEAKVNNELTENEYDHVFIGKYNLEPKLNMSEAENWKWISISDLETEIKQKPDLFTVWFKIIFSTLREKKII